MNTRNLLAPVLVSLFLAVGCSAAPEVSDESVGATESSFVSDSGWDVVLTDSYGYGFCLALRNGYMCTSSPTQNYNEAIGDYTLHYPGCATNTPGCGVMGYSRYGLPYYVTRDGVVLANCLQFGSASGPIKCQYIYGNNVRLIRADRSLLRLYGQAFARVADSVACAAAIQGGDVQGAAENCFL